MNKLFKKAAAFILGAAIFTAQIEVLSFAESPAAEGSQTPGTSETEPEQKGISPVVVDYSLSGSDGNILNSVSSNESFNITINVKDLVVKTSDITGASDIDFIKSIDRFKGDEASVEITSQGDDLLEYTVSMQNCRWLGDSNSFGFMVGYLPLDGGYSNGSITVMECRESPDTPDPSAAEPLFKITASDLSEIKEDRKGSFTLTLKNLGLIDAERVLVEVSPSADVVITEESGSQDIAVIESGDSEEIEISYRALDKINSSKQDFSISLHYYYEGSSGEAIGSATAVVSIPAEVSEQASVSEPGPAPIVRVTGQTLANPIVANSEYEYTLTVRNFSDTTVRNICLFLDASDSLYFVNGTETATIDSIAGGSSVNVKVKFRTTETIASVKQGITAHVNYSYTEGGARKTADSDSSVTIIADGAVGASNMAAPNIIIKSYDIGAEQIAAGETFNLDLKLFNTSSKTGVENVIMTVNAGGDINIYGGGNTFFYPAIAESGEVAETIPLKALSTAETGASSVTVSLKYDYLDKETRTTSTMEQMIFIPVYQPDRMTFDVTVPTYSIYAGNETYITTTYLNKGKSDISNVKAEIVGDVSALSTSKVLGTLKPGDNGSFDFVVTPFMAGQCEFTIKITYEDSTMKEVVKEYPVSFAVEDMYDPGFEDPGMFDPGMEEPVDEGGNFPWVLLWIGIGVLVVGGVVTIIIVVNHKKKKKKQLSEADIDWEDDLDDTNSTTKV